MAIVRYDLRRSCEVNEASAMKHPKAENLLLLVLPLLVGLCLALIADR